MEKTQEFGKLRNMLFPIHRSELKKFIPLSLIFCLISFNYSGLRSLKDMFIMQHMRAEVIYYVKLLGVTPGIIILTILYSRLSKSTNRDGRFNVVIAYFIIFFGLSYFLFIPNLEMLQPNGFVNMLTAKFPAMKDLWEAIRYWPFSLFYIHAEAWGTMALGVLFWTFVNEITSAAQAKRFYSFLSLGAAVGLIVAGILLKKLSANFNLMIGLILVLMVLILVIYNILAHDIKKNPALYQVEQKPKKKKEKLSFAESFKFLMKSEYLALISMLVITYGAVVSLFESVWKSQINELVRISGDKEGMLATIYGDQGIMGGVVSILLIIFLSAPIMNRGWRFAASVTPIVALITTLIFFSFLFFQEYLGGVAAFFNTSPLALAVAFGLINVVFIKSAKYILFDPTKEQAYIPLDEESKVRGKAAVDGVGSRLGKSLGSLLITTLLVPILGSINDAKNYIFLLIILMLVLWMRAVKKLSIQFEQRIQDKAASTNTIT